MDKVLFAKYIYEQVNQQRDRLALRNNFLLTIYTAITSATIGGVFRFLNLSWLKPRDSWELISTEKIFTKLSR